MKTRYASARIVIVCSLAAILVFAGCSKQTAMPPEIAVDRSACSRCSMLISDGRFAAAIKQHGKYLVFDDIGCMLSYLREQVGAAATELWVRDYATNQWIGAEHAEFFHADGDVTPMGYGYIAVVQPNTKPPTGLPSLQRIGALEQLRTDYQARIK